MQETERRYLARELHDEVGQSLTGLKLALDLGVRKVAESNPQLDEASRLAKRVLGLVREMSLNLRPAMLDDIGLLPTLEWHFERFELQTNIKARFSFQCDTERFPMRIETALYRIIQEALTNIARHAQVDEVDILIWQEEGWVGLQIIDQGIGFDVSAALHANQSSGVAGMYDRVRLLDGEIKIVSQPNHGTTVKVYIPIDTEVEL